MADTPLDAAALKAARDAIAARANIDPPLVLAEAAIRAYLAASGKPVAWRTDIFEQLPSGRLSRVILDAADVTKPDDDWIPLYAAPQSGPTATHRHKKRGAEYVLIGYGKMQAGPNWRVLSSPEGSRNLSFYPKADILDADMREVAIYRSVDDGSLWVRPREEFEDGRFEAMDQETSP